MAFVSMMICKVGFNILSPFKMAALVSIRLTEEMGD